MMGTVKEVRPVALRQYDRILPSGKICKVMRRDNTFTSIIRRVI